MVNQGSAWYVMFSAAEREVKDCLINAGQEGVIEFPRGNHQDQVKYLLIIGAGGHGKVVADVADSLGYYDEIFFIDARFPALAEHYGCRVIGDDQSIDYWIRPNVSFVVAVGDNSIRSGIFSSLSVKGASLATLIAPSATIASGCTIGAGTVVFPKATIGPDTTIGNNVILNTACKLGGYIKIEDHAHIAPGSKLSVGVTVRSHALVGAGAVLSEGSSLGANSTLGAGAFLDFNLSSGRTAVGRPAVQLNR